MGKLKREVTFFLVPVCGKGKGQCVQNDLEAWSGFFFGANKNRVLLCT
jgi:hypothetical protein